MAVTMKRTAELLPLVLPYCPTCPDFVAEQMIRLAAIDFAEKSRSWRHVAEIDMSEGVWTALLTGTVEAQDYGLLFAVGGGVFRAKAVLRGDESTLAAPTIAVIHEIEFADWNGMRLTPVQYSTFEAEKQGVPQYVSQVTPNSISIWPYEPGILTVSMFLKPSSASQFMVSADTPLFDRFNVIPDFFVSLHGQTLALGALARILSIPDEPWTNDQKALFYKGEFEQKLNGAFRQNMRGQQRAPIRTVYRDF